MPSDLPLVPIHLWNWGIQHRVGRLKQVSEKALRIALLPKVKATLSDLGLKILECFITVLKYMNKVGCIAKTISRPQFFK